MNPLGWIRHLFARDRLNRDLADEIELHLEEKVDELMAAGLTRPDATAAARRAFGNVTLVREQSQDVWRMRAAHDLASDVRYAARQLRRTPSFAAAAILTLAIGIGANSAIFSVVNTVVLRPLPFHQPSSLVAVESMSTRGTPHRETLSYFTFFEFRRAGVFERIACYRGFGVTLTGGDLPVQLDGQVVSWDLFDVLGVPPVLGRGFLPADEAPSARVVVLSYDTWQTQFGADPGIVGRSILIDDEPNTVVGVAAPGFTFPIRNQRVQIWTTLARDASSATVQPITEQRGARLLNAVARLSPGQTIEQARAQLDAVATRLAAEYPASHKNLSATYVQLEVERLLGDAREPILILWGAVALVLLIACANIANMLLARTADRQHELNVRVAIGGSRARVVRQLLTENLTLATAGAVTGVFVAIAVDRLLVPLAADYLPRAADVHVDGGVLAFATGLALTVAVLVSLPSALWVGRTGLGCAMRHGSRGLTDTQERLRGALVVAQVSVGLILLCGASVLGAAFLHLTRRDLGFSPENLLAFRIELPDVRYSTDRQIEFIDRLLEQLESAPGVSSASVGLPLPLSGSQMTISFNIEERPSGPSERPSSNVALVSPGYFRTIGTSILAGREFTDADDERHPRVVVVNQAFADKFFPGGRAIGKRIASGATSNRDRPGTMVFREIVGIVGNARQAPRGREPDPIYYFPYKQLPWGPPSVIARTTLPAATILPEIRRIVAALDPQIPVHDVKTLNSMLASGVAAPRFEALLMASFAGIGLLLTATGLYGLLSYAVSRRTREIGVRMALGASGRSIVSMILGRALLLIAIGTVLGGIGAWAGRALLQRMVFALDVPHLFAWLCGATVIVLLTAVAAACPPALRAASVDPTMALRAE